jgi:hypothetical protein
MDLNEDVVADANGTQPIHYDGPGVRSAPGKLGDAVELTQAPSIGTVTNSSNDNPGKHNFAIGVVFTSQRISGGDYSGNLMQKGLYGDPGQVKLELVPDADGTVACRLKGSSGSKTITSTVTVDDGRWHTTVCWRAGSQVGITVDGVVKSRSWNPGYIGNDRNLVLGNKTSRANASDQHFGRTDFASWVIDPNARAIVEAQVAVSG